MNFVNKSGVIRPQPAIKEERKVYHNYIFECCYFQDVIRFKDALDDAGARLVSIVPCTHEVIGGEYIVTYRHTEELDCEVYT